MTAATNGNSRYSPGREMFARFVSDRLAVAGVAVIACLIFIAVYAPFFANGRPLAVWGGGEGLSFPAMCSLFTAESPEILVEKTFNSLMLLLPAFGMIILLTKRTSLRFIFASAAAAAVVAPMIFFTSAADLSDWHEKAETIRANGGHVIFAPVEYGPYEICSAPYAPPSAAHPMGTDHSGRDVLARMFYGARVSTAVGLAATAISMLIGTFTGLFAGYKGGRIDLYTMRAVEMVICFPQFLLLLILMSIMLDYGSRQSILLVILVIGLFGWPGLCRLVRGETLKQRAMPYIQAAEALGVPTVPLMLKHLLPNVSGPVFVTLAFDVAGAILAESSLSFLGFGVQDPTASWGELMRQAFPDPVTYWNLTLWPGLAIFLAVCSFNFLGEGLRKASGV